VKGGLLKTNGIGSAKIGAGSAASFGIIKS
jgi:hypothetical protein